VVVGKDPATGVSKQRSFTVYGGEDIATALVADGQPLKAHATPLDDLDIADELDTPPTK
jgi:hypothetical protein